MDDATPSNPSDAARLEIRVDETGRFQRALGDAVWSSGPAGATRCGSEPFARWRHDAEGVSVEVDPLGLQPLFVARTSGGVHVSPSVAALVTAMPDVALDHAAIAAFCLLGMFVGDRTPFVGIRAAPPGWRLEVDADGTRESFFAPDVKAMNLDDDAILGELSRRFRAAVRRRLEAGGGPVGEAGSPELVTLTGGMDSRHILCELVDQVGPDRVSALTVQLLRRMGDDDVTIAARVAAELGVDHRVVPGVAYDVAQEARKNPATNFNALDHGWACGLADALPRGARVWDGLAGDVVIDGLYASRRQLEAARSGDVETWSRTLTTVKGGTERLVRAAMGELAESIDLDAGRALIREELARHVGRPNPITSFWFWNRTRRAVAACPLGLYGHGVDVMLPFADLALWELAMSVPGERLIGQAMHRRLLERDHPAAVALPLAGTDFSPRARLARLPDHVQRMRRSLAADGRGISERARVLAGALGSLGRGGRRSEFVTYPFNVSRLRAWRRSLEGVRG